MFEIKNFHKNVFIDGNILFETDDIVSYTDIVCYSTFKKNDCIKSIKADMLNDKCGEEFYYISNNLICEDDVIYQVTGDVVSYGNERKLANPYNCIYTYNHNILDLKAIFESEVNKSKPLGNNDISINLVFRTLYSLSSVNRMLFQAILSNYELFVMDILVTCFLRFDGLRESILKRKRFYGLCDTDVVLRLRSYQYNNFRDEVENLFLTLLDVKLPDYSYLKDAYEIRNNFAHRYFTTQYGQAIEVKNEELIKLVQETNKFVYELFDRVIKRVYI